MISLRRVEIYSLKDIPRISRGVVTPTSRCLPASRISRYFPGVVTPVEIYKCKFSSKLSRDFPRGFVILVEIYFYQGFPEYLGNNITKEDRIFVLFCNAITG
jgi:hypothetical protein